MRLNFSASDPEKSLLSALVGAVVVAGKVNDEVSDDVGKVGEKEDCLSYIKQVWTDMRPLSVRKQLALDNVSRSQSVN